MNEQSIREIAERAFKSHFGDLKLVTVNVRTRRDHDDEPVVDVHLVYDGKYERMTAPGLRRVSSEIVGKAWREVEDDLGFPMVHFFAKTDLGRRDPTTV